MIVAILAGRISYDQTHGVIRFLATVPTTPGEPGRAVLDLADIHLFDLRIDMGPRNVNPRLGLRGR